MDCMNWDVTKGRCRMYVDRKCEGCGTVLTQENFIKNEISIWAYMYKKGANKGDLNKQRKYIQDMIMKQETIDFSSSLVEEIEKNTENFEFTAAFKEYVNQTIRRAAFVGLNEVYHEDKKRGGGPSKSESVSKDNKQIMNDNRDQDTKTTYAEKQEIADATKEWEEEHGKLETLSKYR